MDETNFSEIPTSGTLSFHCVLRLHFLVINHTCVLGHTCTRSRNNDPGTIINATHDLNLAGLFWSNTNDLILLVNRNSRFRIYRLERSPIFYKIIIACFMLCIFKVILMLDNIITASDINETSSNLEDRFYIHEEKLLFKIQLGDRSRVILIAKAGKIRWARMEEVKGLEFFSFYFFPAFFFILIDDNLTRKFLEPSSLRSFGRFN